MAWDFLKADSKDPHELRTQQFQEGIQGLRDLFNHPSPDNFNPITAIEGVRNEDDLIERSIDSGWNQAQDAMAWDEFERRITTNRSERDEEAVREFVNRQPQKPNFGIPMQTEQTRLPTLSSSKMLNPVIGNAKLKEMNRRIAENKNKPYRLGSTSNQVDQEVNLNNNKRWFKDKQEAAKLHLRDNPPRLERDGSKDDPSSLYNIMSGKKEVGHVGIDEMAGGIGYGEVKPAYQRQGLYGKTLQAIINEREVLHSDNRNQNSQPFHEQFNPPNTGKYVSEEDRNLNATHTYRALPPQETPENWGALEYDTGALPIYQGKPAEERNAISPRGNSKQQYIEGYFQKAWELLKANSKQAVYTNYQTRLPIEPTPKMLHDFELRDKNGNPYLRVLPAELEKKEAARKLADQREKARAHLQQNPAYLRRTQLDDGISYHMMAGNKNIGHVGVERNAEAGMPVIEGEDDEHDIGNSEVNPEYQRQGVYGRALQGIINDVGTLSSTNRNENSQPFHQQFNPPNTEKKLQPYYGEFDDNIETANLFNPEETNRAHIYTQQPQKETPRDWGALQYDTGAMPVLDNNGPLQPPALEPSNREQTSLGQWGYVPGYPRYN